MVGAMVDSAGRWLLDLWYPAWSLPQTPIPRNYARSHQLNGAWTKRIIWWDDNDVVSRADARFLDGKNQPMTSHKSYSTVHLGSWFVQNSTDHHDYGIPHIDRSCVCLQETGIPIMRYGRFGGSNPIIKHVTLEVQQVHNTRQPDKDSPCTVFRVFNIDSLFVWTLLAP